MKGNFQQSAVTQFISVNNTQYAYRVLGINVGIPLILFQHFTGNMENWDPDLINGLAEHFKVILFDNKGVGGSEGTISDNISDMAKDAESFIDALGYKKVNLFGFSMGGFIIQQIALNRPEIVNKMILAGTRSKGGEGITDILNPLNVVSTMEADDSKLYLFYSPSESSKAIGKRILEKMKERQTDRD